VGGLFILLLRPPLQVLSSHVREMVVAAADRGHSAGLDNFSISCGVMGQCDSSFYDQLAGLWIGPVEPNPWPTRSPDLTPLDHVFGGMSRTCLHSTNAKKS